MEKVPSPTDRKTLSDTLRDAAKVEQSLPNLPLKYAEIVKSQTSYLDSEQRKEAIALIRSWVSYAEKHNVSDTDPFAVRYHISKFAEESFGRQREHISLEEVAIGDVSSEGKSYRDTITPYVTPEIINDANVAIIGGTARLGLKMHAGADIKDELPISDVDIVVSTAVNIPETVRRYKVDLAGAKIVDGNVREALPDLITNFDCTMNQVAVHDGKLLFPARALQDIKEGNIRLIGKDDPLFGSEGIAMPDGNVYLNRNGFYRGLSFLLRGKGQRLIVSKENLEIEKNNIGRYWLVMLFVKILPMKNEDTRRDAISHWHEIAQRIGSTQTDNPEDFLKELMAKYPETRAYSGAEGAFDTDAQVRWLIGKLTSKAVDEIYGQESVQLPNTYTEANLELSKDVRPYDFDAFMQTVKSISESQK
jgi:hypothetical protein